MVKSKVPVRLNLINHPTVIFVDFRLTETRRVGSFWRHSRTYKMESSKVMDLNRTQWDPSLGNIGTLEYSTINKTKPTTGS